MSILAENRKIFFEYEVLETFEAGVVLFGYEVKAVKTGHINLAGSFVVIKNEELFLINADIPPYQPKNTPKEYDPRRSRKLLLHKAEIKSLIGKIRQKGLTLVPLKVYTQKGKIKLQFGIARGKKKYDKRETIKRREFNREKGRALKNS